MQKEVCEEKAAVKQVKEQTTSRNDSLLLHRLCLASSQPFSLPMRKHLLGIFIFSPGQSQWPIFAEVFLGDIRDVFRPLGMVDFMCS